MGYWPAHYWATHYWPKHYWPEGGPTVTLVNGSWAGVGDAPRYDDAANWVGGVVAAGDGATIIYGSGVAPAANTGQPTSGTFNFTVTAAGTIDVRNWLGAGATVGAITVNHASARVSGGDAGPLTVTAGYAEFTGASIGAVTVSAGASAQLGGIEGGTTVASIGNAGHVRGANAGITVTGTIVNSGWVGTGVWICSGVVTNTGSLGYGIWTFSSGLNSTRGDIGIPTGADIAVSDFLTLGTTRLHLSDGLAFAGLDVDLGDSEINGVGGTLRIINGTGAIEVTNRSSRMQGVSVTNLTLASGTPVVLWYGVIGSGDDRNAVMWRRRKRLCGPQVVE